MGAGSGADAAPFFRIFNPVLQGQKFDPHAIYAKRWIPELEPLPAELIYKRGGDLPELLALEGRAQAYPPQIVDHDEARRRALEAFRSLRS